MHPASNMQSVHIQYPHLSHSYRGPLSSEPHLTHASGPITTSAMPSSLHLEALTTRGFDCRCVGLRWTVLVVLFGYLMASFWVSTVLTLAAVALRQEPDRRPHEGRD